MLQNIGLATSLDTLQYELSEGSEVEVCYLFDVPRSQNWIGVNHTVQITSTMSFGCVTFVEGLVDTGKDLQHVKLMIDTRTGEGRALIVSVFPYKDRVLIEAALAFMNTAAQGIPSAI